MKKCIKIVLFTFIILISLLSISSFSATPDLKSIDVNSLNLDSIPKNKVEDLKQAAVINTSKCMLDSKLHCIGVSERKGVCHMLVNDNKLKWVSNE